MAAAGEDLLKLTSFCLLLAGLLVLGVGITGVAGAVAGGRGWLTLVSDDNVKIILRIFIRIFTNQTFNEVVSTYDLVHKFSSCLQQFQTPCLMQVDTSC